MVRHGEGLEILALVIVCALLLERIFEKMRHHMGQADSLWNVKAFTD